MEWIGQYRQLTEFTNEHAGTSEWCTAEKDGRTYFVKKFQKPVYPSEHLGLAPDIYQKRVERFHAEEDRYRKLYDCLNASNKSGVLLVPEVVTIYQFHICAVSAYFEGNIKPGEISSLSPRRKIKLMRKLVSGLMDVHSTGIVHGDMKADNVLVHHDVASGRYDLKLVDFDSSYFAMDAPASAEDIGGDMAYWAPEIYAKYEYNSIKLDERIDNFALGMILHLMWCGSLPQKPDGLTLGQYIWQGNQPKIDGRIPLPIAEAISALLCADPQQRMDLEQVYGILSAQLDNYPPEARTYHPGNGESGSNDKGSVPPDSRKNRPGEGKKDRPGVINDPGDVPPPGKLKWSVILCVAAIILVMIAGGYFIVRSMVRKPSASGDGVGSGISTPPILSTDLPAATSALAPTDMPTRVPTAVPTQAPIADFTTEPTAAPTRVPTAVPTRVPTKAPNAVPTRVQTAVPTKASTYVVVDSGDTNVRSGPGLGYTSVGVLRNGTQVRYLNLVSTDERGVDWYWIEYNGNSAWVSSRYTKLVSGSIGFTSSVSSYVKAAAGQSYVRSGPGKDYQTMGVMKKGTSAPYLNETATDERGVKWYKISYNGKEGWVSSRYTELQ